MELTFRPDLTYRANVRASRHGWLRLTPAYAVNLVEEILREVPLTTRVLDPFCGTGTTALTAAHAGLNVTTTDINPFLVWLARAKTRPYEVPALLDEIARRVAEAILTETADAVPPPPLYRVERWWGPTTLAALCRGVAALHRLEHEEVDSASLDLLRVAFCATLIESARVSFSHQSMSFKVTDSDESAAQTAARYEAAMARIRTSLAPQPTGTVSVLHADARALDEVLAPRSVNLVVASPPYPNRMSYVRELRPYMYWLGYLTDGAAAGELDWKAIGGTWGVATSRGDRWRPPQNGAALPLPTTLARTCAAIEKKSAGQARYVERYFYDIAAHLKSLSSVVVPGGAVHYVVGNSKYYDTIVPVEEWYGELLAAANFHSVTVRALRKRSSKKELYEFLVSAVRDDERA